MYIALNHPVVPEYKATVKLTPVTEPEPMKVINKYKGEWNGRFWFYATVTWILFLLVANTFFHV